MRNKRSDTQTGRNEEMKRIRAEGWALDDLAEKYGRSRQRIQQIVGGDRVWRRSKTTIEQSRQREEARYAFAAQHPEMTTAQLADALGLRGNCISKYWSGNRHAVKPDTQTSMGWEIEECVSRKLTAHGIPHRLTNSRPVDIVLADGRTVEVKSRWMPDPYSDSENFYFFPMSRERKAGRALADIYIFAIVTSLPEPDLFIIPASMLPATFALGFCWPRGRDRGYGHMDYREFLERWDILRPPTPTLWESGKDENKIRNRIQTLDKAQKVDTARVV